jgi:serpin B
MSVKLMNHTFQGNETRYADITNGPVPFQMLSLNYQSNASGRNGGGAFGQGASPVRRGPNNGGPGLSMLVVLPRNAGDLGTLEKATTAEQLASWVGEMKPARVQVFLPKFKLNARYDQMPDQLKQLGIVDAFIPPSGQSGADFSGMNGVRGLIISKVIHQTFVSVDEKGTEAAAATVVLMGFGGAPRAEAPPPVFRADHPFLLFIRENATGSILFMGRLADPSVSINTEGWEPAGATGQPNTLVNPSASSLVSSQTATPSGDGPRAGFDAVRAAENAAGNRGSVPGSGMRGRGGTTADVELNSLRLDAATRAKVKPILDDELNKMKDLQADKTLSFEDKDARNKSIKADTDAQLKLVLTDDQFARWQKISQPSQSQ